MQVMAWPLSLEVTRSLYGIYAPTDRIQTLLITPPLSTVNLIPIATRENSAAPSCDGTMKCVHTGNPMPFLDASNEPHTSTSSYSQVHISHHHSERETERHRERQGSESVLELDDDVICLESIADRSSDTLHYATPLSTDHILHFHGCKSATHNERMSQRRHFCAMPMTSDAAGSQSTSLSL